MESILPGATIGIIGGGQLGQMTAMAAERLGYRTHIYTSDKEGPAEQVATHTTIASYTDKEALEAFASSVDVVTFEFENIPVESVKHLESHVTVRPSHVALEVAQNRIREKRFLQGHNIATTAFFVIESAQDLEEGFAFLGGEKALLKTTELGYDGKGQYRLDSSSDLTSIWQESGMKEGILEAFIDFEKEVSVIVARAIDGKSVAFPVAENVHKQGILDTSTAPADIPDALAGDAVDIAKVIAEQLGLIGLLAVEFFVTKEGTLLVNEMAPRPHNSGHWTMDGSKPSQFEQFVHAVCGQALLPVKQHTKIMMTNLIGHDVEKAETFREDESAVVHLYGKKEVREGRKMGHVNTKLGRF